MNSFKSIIVGFAALINDTRGTDGAETWSSAAKVGAGGFLVITTGGVLTLASSTKEQGEKIFNTQQTAIDNTTRPINGSGGASARTVAPNVYGQSSGIN